MIVNVNPYDTGYDENLHVMKFSALAKDVYTTNAPALIQKAPSIGPGRLRGQNFKDFSPMTINDPEVNPNPFRRRVTITMGKRSEAILEVVEGRSISVFSEAQLEYYTEDEAADDIDDYDEEPLNPLIDALFDEVEDLRLKVRLIFFIRKIILWTVSAVQLFEAEMRCALTEAETREEVMREMEERMRIMEEKYSRRLMSEVSFYSSV